MGEEDSRVEDTLVFVELASLGLAVGPGLRHGFEGEHWRRFEEEGRRLADQAGPLEDHDPGLRMGSYCSSHRRSIHRNW